MAHIQSTARASAPGVLHPHFSHDGSMLFWAELHEPIWGGPHGGNWRLKLADFVDNGTGPRLENVRIFEPVNGSFYESHGFSLDDTRLIFSSNLNGTEQAYDLYTCDLNGQDLANLTNRPDEWDEHAHYSPGGQKIIWMSTRFFDWPGTPFSERTELFVMDPNGSNIQQLTHYNEGSVQRQVASDCSWSPDGSRIVSYKHAGIGGEAIYIITLNGEY